MPVAASEVKLYASANGGLGGAIDLASELTSGTLNQFIQKVSGADQASGQTYYYCFYVRNEDAEADVAQGTTLYLFSDTSEISNTVGFGLGAAATNASETAIANHQEVPGGVTFTDTTGAGAAITIGNLNQNDYKSVWLRLVVDLGATASASQTASFRIVFDSVA